MKNKKRILLKLTGTVLADPQTKGLTTLFIMPLIHQIKKLLPTHQFGLVIGGGNFFRGNQQGSSLGITPAISHQIGMLSTIMNGLIVKDLMEKQSLEVSHFCALFCPEIGMATTTQKIMDALLNNHTLIFTAGTGNPFFTTDTSAVLRALQMQADEIWKGTNVDGVYTADPNKNSSAQRIPVLTYKQALDQQFTIMDATAFTLADHYKQRIRIFNIFTPDALIHAAQNKMFGSILEPEG
ncbi:MAG: hypothetical protein WCD44_04805 [Candidatus Babeliales bacterium]|jgi:uridylate kinase